MAHGTIYILTNFANGKNYIGQTRRSVRQRWNEHRFHTRHSNRRSVLYAAMKKYGEEAFVVQVLAEVPTEALLNFTEALYIEEFDTMNRLKGYNRMEGGQNSPLTQETKDKISASRKGMPAHNKGKKMSVEQRVKLSLACMGRTSGMKGKRMSVEQRNTMSLAHKAIPTPHRSEETGRFARVAI